MNHHHLPNSPIYSRTLLQALLMSIVVVHGTMLFDEGLVAVLRFVLDTPPKLCPPCLDALAQTNALIHRSSDPVVAKNILLYLTRWT